MPKTEVCKALTESANPSIERTRQKPLRAFWPAAHVERWAPGGEVCLASCTVASAGVGSVVQRSGVASSMHRVNSSGAPRCSQAGCPSVGGQLTVIKPQANPRPAARSFVSRAAVLPCCRPARHLLPEGSMVPHVQAVLRVAGAVGKVRRSKFLPSCSSPWRIRSCRPRSGGLPVLRRPADGRVIWQFCGGVVVGLNASLRIAARRWLSAHASHTSAQVASSTSSSVVFIPALWPNPSIERTSNSGLRPPLAAAHVKR